MEFLFKLKWLNGPLAGSELDLPAGDIRLGGEDPDIVLPLELGVDTVLTVSPQGVTMAPPLPVWSDGLPWDASQPLPLGPVIDLAGQALVLVEAGGRWPSQLVLPARRRLPPKTNSPRGFPRKGWVAAFVAVVLLLAVVAGLWVMSKDEPPFQPAAWLAQQMADPELAGLHAELDAQGVVQLTGLGASSQRIQRLREQLARQGLHVRDQSQAADALRQQVRRVLALYGYHNIEVVPGPSWDQVVIYGAIQANDAWLRTSEQLRMLRGLKDWRVVNDHAELFRLLLRQLTNPSLLDGLSIEVSGNELLISGQLEPARAQALAVRIEAFNSDGPPRLRARFQNIPAAQRMTELLPAAIVSVGGNANAVYLELANGMRLQQGGTLPNGYQIFALSHAVLTLIKDQRLISIPLHL